MYLMDIQVHSVPDPMNMVLVWISVIILYFILKHFLHKPIKEFLKKREDLVLGNIAKAEADREEAAALKAEYESRLEAAQAEGAAIVEDYRERGEAMYAKLVRESEAEAKLIIDRGQRELEQRQSQAMAHLESEAGDLAVQLARKILQEKMARPGAQDTLVDSFISDLEQPHG